MDGSILVLIFILGALFLLAVHFVPSYIAFKKHTSSRWLVFFINLFFGWTFFGWGIALFMAMSAAPRYRLPNQYYGPPPVYPGDTYPPLR